jgi:hypothetical protein
MLTSPDIARAAGVPQTTVSRVLNDDPDLLAARVACPGIAARSVVLRSTLVCRKTMPPRERARKRVVRVCG